MVLIFIWIFSIQIYFTRSRTSYYWYSVWMIWNMLCFVLICIIIKIYHLYLLSISLSHTLNAFVPYGYVVILLNVCNFYHHYYLVQSYLFSQCIHCDNHFEIFVVILVWCYCLNINFSILFITNFSTVYL